MSPDVRERPGDGLADDPRPCRVHARAGAGGLAVVGVALVVGGFAGCGGGGGGSDSTASSTTASSARQSTTAPASTAGGTALARPTKLGSEAAIRSVVETVLTSSDPAVACGKYVTPHYLDVAYGGKQACIQAQRPGIAAKSLSSFRIERETGQGRAVSATVVLHGGPYDGSTANVGLLFQAGNYRVNALGANVPVGP